MTLTNIIRSLEIGRFQNRATRPTAAENDEPLPTNQATLHGDATANEAAYLNLRSLAASRDSYLLAE